MRQDLLKTNDIRLFLSDFFQNQRSAVNKIVGSILAKITANIKCYKFHDKTLLFIPSILCSMFAKSFPQSASPTLRYVFPYSVAAARLSCPHSDKIFRNPGFAACKRLFQTHSRHPSALPFTTSFPAAFMLAFMLAFPAAFLAVPSVSSDHHYRFLCFLFACFRR